MASRDTGRTLTTRLRCMGDGGGHAVDSDQGCSRGTCAESGIGKQKSGSPAGDEPKDITPAGVAIIGQWVCFVLGVICIVCGTTGIFMKQMDGTPSASVAWLGPAYLPTLRGTALFCLLIGLLLVRRGWSGPPVSRKERR